MNLLEYLHIKVTKESKQQVILSIDVSEKIMQPFGIVHGGINTILAETAASMLANLNAPIGSVAIGVSINTNHLLPTTTGRIDAIANPIKIGNKIQVLTVTTFAYPQKIKTSQSIVTTTFHKK
ncbi:hotdog fold thioesterase [Liquorilactobacillus cacaonum]|uniref:ComA operon protein 2 n=1 Tax=Liquorilactobacillus cacaonum DSM 21116 TaxID=1423729 RepID=A0A0R2CP26_9LACO|nr:hotdog fold thioesterase [Liquorilactobacillus cacaonum]KRM92722.1 ComA operon protein 2 [Liquorilactobacillus cacaonum DSM 21116]